MKIRKVSICLSCKHKFVLIVPHRLSPEARFKIWNRWNRIVDIHASNCGIKNVDDLVERFEEDLLK